MPIVQRIQHPYSHAFLYICFHEVLFVQVFGDAEKMISNNGVNIDNVANIYTVFVPIYNYDYQFHLCESIFILFIVLTPLAILLICLIVYI